MASQSTGDDLSFLGTGIILPFQRDEKNDFANGHGKALIKSSLETILGTTCASGSTYGELPFDQGMGSLLLLIKHLNLDDPALEELAIFYVVDAIDRHEPRVKLTGIRFVKNRPDMKLSIWLSYDIISRDNARNNVLVSNVVQEITG